MFLTDIWVFRSFFSMTEIQGVTEFRKPEFEVLVQVLQIPFRPYFANPLLRSIASYGKEKHLHIYI